MVGIFYDYYQNYDMGFYFAGTMIFLSGNLHKSTFDINCFINSLCNLRDILFGIPIERKTFARQYYGLILIKTNKDNLYEFLKGLYVNFTLTLALQG